MWNQILKTIRFKDFSEADLARVKKATMASLRDDFADWKSKLNCNYVKKGRLPFDKYGNIPPSDWDTFVQQKTTPEALALSEKMTELNKKNLYPVHLGPGGYRAKVEKWREQEEALESQGKANPVRSYNDRTKNWIRARSDLTDEGQIIAKDSKSAEVIERIQGPVQQAVEKGEFVPLYHKDHLWAGLKTKEKGGRTRGVSSKATFKEGFANTDPHMYKKHDFFKKDIEEQARKAGEESARKVCEEYFSTMMPGLAMVPVNAPQTPVPSSVASTPEYPPIPDITVSTPCELYMVFGRNGKRKMVATGFALPGRELHNKQMSKDYVKVDVREIVDGYHKVELEEPIPEAEVLEDAVGTFIAWNRRDVVLLTSTPRASPLSAQGSVRGADPSPGSTHAPSPPPVMDHGPSPSAPPPPINDQGPSPPPANDQGPSPPQVNKDVPRSLIHKSIIGHDNQRTNVNVEKWMSSMKNRPKSAATVSAQQIDEAAKVRDYAQWRKPMSYDDNILWDMASDDYPKYEYGKQLLPLVLLYDLPAPMRKFHDFYMQAAKEGVRTISAKIPGSLMNHDDCTLAWYFDDFHRLFRLESLDITFVTLFCV